MNGFFAVSHMLFQSILKGFGDPLVSSQILFTAFAISMAVAGLCLGLIVGYRNGWAAGASEAEFDLYAATATGQNYGTQLFAQQWRSRPIIISADKDPAAAGEYRSTSGNANK